MARVAVIGSGAWGTTLARLMALEQIRVAGDGADLQAPNQTPIGEVLLWEHQSERATQLQWRRENSAFLPGFPLPANLLVTADLAEAARGAEIVLLVTPSQRLRENARMLAPLLSTNTVVVNCSKGLELGTHLRLTEVIAQEVPTGTSIATLSGPNLAEEIARGMPAAAVVACENAAAAERVQTALTTPTFRIYTSEDVVGVELGGALKNIVAIGVGVSDGLGYGDNAKASLITRAIAEISRLAMAAGANPLTLAGLAGLGDLIATCSSSLSRNRTLGLELARGRKLDEILAERRSVAEGVTTTKAALEMAAAFNVDLPIAAEMASVLFEGKPLREAVQSLMVRDPKRELHGLHG